jgi:hypothetical protein
MELELPAEPPGRSLRRLVAARHEADLCGEVVDTHDEQIVDAIVVQYSSK